MLDVGPLIHYQHYRPPAELLEGQALAPVVILGLQTLLVVWACVRSRSTIYKLLRRSRVKWRLLAAIVLVALISAPVSRHVARFLVELPLAAFIQLVQVATVAMMAAAWPSDVPVSIRRWRLGALVAERAMGDAEERRVDPVSLFGAVWVVVVASVLAIFSYQSHPHVPDEVAYFMQARHLSHGALSTPSPPSPEGFGMYLMQFETDRWYGVMPPAFPALLGIGLLAGLPWLVNPLLGGLNVILVGLLVKELYGRRTSRLVLLLLCTSPWFIFLAMSFMNHTMAMTCAVLAAWAVIRARHSGGLLWGLAAGTPVGLLSLVRPLDAVIVAGLLGLWSLGLGGQRLRIRALAGFGAGVLLVGAINLPYNIHLTGHALRTPVMEYMNAVFGPKANEMGFGPERGANWPLDPFPGHGLRDVIVNADLNLFSVNVELLGWSVGSLLLGAVTLLIGRRHQSDRLMIAVILAVIAFYSCYWYSGGPDFGARYWYLILVPALVLTARGVEVLTGRFAGSSFESREVVRSRILAAILALCLMTVISYIPWRAVDKYRYYRNMRPGVRKLAREHDFGRSLVLVRGEKTPDYASAIVYNPVDLYSDATIYAWDHSPGTRQALLEAYPGRPVWFVSGPSVTGGGYRLEAGPLTAAEARTWQPRQFSGGFGRSFRRLPSRAESNRPYGAGKRITSVAPPPVLSEFQESESRL
jgi:hypothetical protein